MDELPMFYANGPRLTYRNPKLVTAGVTVSREAVIDIDTQAMTQEFLLRLMWHMAEGHVRVRIAQREE